MEYKIRASSLTNFMKGTFGMCPSLTATEQKKLAEFDFKVANGDKRASNSVAYQRLCEKAKLEPSIKLSESPKAVCVDTFLKQEFGWSEVLTTPQILKGLMREDESIQVIGFATDQELTKNQHFFENDYIKGTPDVLTEDRVIEVKTASDFKSFFTMDEEAVKAHYYYQVQAYMWLTGFDKADLYYVYLPETSEEIEAQKKSLSYRLSADSEVYKDVVKQIEKNNSLFLSPEQCIKKFEFVKNEQVIEKVIDRVKFANEFVFTKLKRNEKF